MFISNFYILAQSSPAYLTLLLFMEYYFPYVLVFFPMPQNSHQNSPINS
jgi:hypothetical protein